MKTNSNFFIHGFLPGIGSALCFALMAAIVKIVSESINPSQIVFFRSIFGLCFILPFVLHKGLPFLKTTKIKLHLLRGFVSLLAMTCFYFSIANIGLAEATLLNAASPLFIGILATLFLNENLTRIIIINLVIGFIGVTLILKPGTDLFQLAALVGLASAFFIGSAKILIRYMADTEPVLRTITYFSIFTTFYSAIPMLWLWKTPDINTVLLMLLASVFATGGQTLLTYAFTHNPAIRVSPFTYATVVFATLLGWIGWQELPDIGSSIGALLVVVACLSITLKGKLPNPWAKKKPVDN